MVHNSLTYVEKTVVRDLFLDRLTVEDGTGSETSAPNYYSTLCKNPKRAHISSRYALVCDTVGTVYHLVIYMQSNKIHNVVLMTKFYSALTLARHVSDLTGPSSGAFCTSCIRRFGMW